MKRDMDIIRLLLLQLETGDRPSQLDNFSEERVTYNAALMVHAGLVKGAFARGGDGDSLGVAMDRMTWSGHDFLDAAVQRLREHGGRQRAPQAFTTHGAIDQHPQLPDVL